MGTKAKSPTKPVRGNGYQTVRPGEVLVRNTTNVVVFVGDPSLNGPNPLDNYAWILRPGTPSIMKAYVFRDPRRDGHHMLATGQLEIVDGDQGVIPGVVNIAESWDRAVARDGKPPRPPRQQQITHWVNVVIDRSLAECVVDALDAGCPEEETVRELVSVYDRSFIERRASSSPWIARTAELIAIQKAKDAGLMPAQGKGE